MRRRAHRQSIAQPVFLNENRLWESDDYRPVVWDMRLMIPRRMRAGMLSTSTSGLNTHGLPVIHPKQRARWCILCGRC